MAINYSKIEGPSERADLLFRVFARFEYSMKKCNRCSGRDDGFIIIHWNQLADQFSDDFFDKICTDPSIEILASNPPYEQFIEDNGELNWRPPGVRDPKRDLLRALRNVRNNLFHGGKSLALTRERDQKLVNASLSLINEILESDDELKLTFEGD